MFMANDNHKLRVAMVGCGPHARESLIPSLWLLDSVVVTAACDSDEASARDAAAKFPHTKVYIDFRTLVQDEVCDAIVAAAPPQVHFEIARCAIDAGLHVFLEKPPAVDLAQLERLSRMAERRHVIAAVGHNLRHTPAVQHIKQLMMHESFGAPSCIDLRYFASKPRGDRWRLGSVLRSFLLSHVTHAIDLMVYLLGPVELVWADSKASSSGAIYLTMALRFRDGAVGTLCCTSGAPHFMVSAALLSYSGQLIQMENLWSVTSFGFAGDPKRVGRVWTSRTLEAGFEHAGYSSELALFVNAALTGASTHPSLQDELEVYRVVEQICERLT